MRRSATPSRSTLLAAVAVASLAAIGVGASAIHDREPAGTAALETPAVVAAPPVAIATPVTAAPAAPARRVEPAPVAEARVAEPVTVGTAGLRATLNTDAPTPIAISDATFNQSSEGLTEVMLPDGSVMVDLEGRFQVYSVQVRDAAGRLHVRCVSDPSRVNDPCLLHGILQPALPIEER